MRWATALALLAAPALAEPLRPAEMPPAEFAGQQYVDSKGCMFVRAGTADAVLWIPRVTRQGEPLCTNPPSGGRAPVAEEPGAQSVPESQASAGPEQGGEGGGYFVAVGSYSVADHAAAAEARVAELQFPSIRGRVDGGGGPLITVFAGPFADAEAAEAARNALVAAGFSDASLIRP